MTGGAVSSGGSFANEGDSKAYSSGSSSGSRYAPAPPGFVPRVMSFAADPSRAQASSSRAGFADGQGALGQSGSRSSSGTFERAGQSLGTSSRSASAQGSPVVREGYASNGGSGYLADVASEGRRSTASGDTPGNRRFASGSSQGSWDYDTLARQMQESEARMAGASRLPTGSGAGQYVQGDGGFPWIGSPPLFSKSDSEVIKEATGRTPGRLVQPSEDDWKYRSLAYEAEAGGRNVGSSAYRSQHNNLELGASGSSHHAKDWAEILRDQQSDDGMLYTPRARSRMGPSREGSASGSTDLSEAVNAIRAGAEWDSNRDRKSAANAGTRRVPERGMSQQPAAARRLTSFGGTRGTRRAGDSSSVGSSEARDAILAAADWDSRRDRKAARKVASRRASERAAATRASERAAATRAAEQAAATRAAEQAAAARAAEQATSRESAAEGGASSSEISEEIDSQALFEQARRAARAARQRLDTISEGSESASQRRYDTEGIGQWIGESEEQAARPLATMDGPAVMADRASHATFHPRAQLIRSDAANDSASQDAPQQRPGGIWNFMRRFGRRR